MVVIRSMILLPKAYLLGMKLVVSLSLMASISPGLEMRLLCKPMSVTLQLLDLLALSALLLMSKKKKKSWSLESVNCKKSLL